MKNFSKSAITPVVAALLLGIGYITHHAIGANVQNQIVTFVSAFAFLYVNIKGIFKNHVKQTVKVVADETKQVAQVVEQAAQQVEGESK